MFAARLSSYAVGLGLVVRWVMLTSRDKEYLHICTYTQYTHICFYTLHIYIYVYIYIYIRIYVVPTSPKIGNTNVFPGEAVQEHFFFQCVLGLCPQNSAKTNQHEKHHDF